MESINVIKPNEDMSSKERAMLQKLLQSYNIGVVEAEKLNHAYIIYTAKETLILRKSKQSRREIKNTGLLTKELIKLGFNNISKYILTSEGNLYTKSNNGIFYMTEWIEGEECDLRDIRDALRYVELLAKLHKTSQLTKLKELKFDKASKNTYQKYNRYLSKIEIYKNIIEGKRIKNEFDAKYYNVMEYQANLGLLSLSLFNKYNYYKLLQHSNTNKTISFPKFSYHNIVKKNNALYITDIGTININLQINDLARLIRKFIKKDASSWNFEKIKQLIDKYSSINPLGKDELGILLAILIFPRKYYSLGKERYIKRKIYSETIYLEKLHKLIKNNRQQDMFIEQYLDYLLKLE